MKLKQMFDMLETRNYIASVFNIPREQLTICVNAITPLDHMPFMGSFENRLDFVTFRYKYLGSLAYAIDGINFDENLRAFINAGSLCFEVRVFVELAPRKGK